MNLESWKLRVKALKREVGTLYQAIRDPQVSWYAMALAAVVVGYAVSPIDFIPDFIAILGYADDLLLVPLGILAVRAMIPASLLDEFRGRSSELEGGTHGQVTATIIALVWIGLAFARAARLYRRLGPGIDRFRSDLTDRHGNERHAERQQELEHRHRDVPAALSAGGDVEVQPRILVSLVTRT